jgi:hypothetical protein
MARSQSILQETYTLEAHLALTLEAVSSRMHWR